MKNFALYFLLIVGLTSCNTYQYTTLKSDLAKNKDTGKYYYRDSLMRMDFDFWGADFPISVFIQNTSNTDLFLNLSRTLFLKNDVIISNAVPDEKGTISGYIYGPDYVHAIVETKSTEKMVYIPAGKKIEMNYAIFSFPFNREIRKKSAYTTQYPDGEPHPNDIFIFPKGKAPHYTVRFYFQTGENTTTGLSLECAFWPNMVFTTDTPPAKFKFSGSDIFYTSRK